MKFVETLILIVLSILCLQARGQFSASPSNLDACQCTGEIEFQPSDNLPFTIQLFDVSDAPVFSSTGQNAAVSIANLCPSVYHIVVEYSNGVIEDDYFEISAGPTPTGDAHRVILCQEAYATGSGGAIPFDLNPELSTFLPGGTWYSPNGLIIPTNSLGSLTAATMESGWYTYVTNSGGCDVTTGIYIQANNTGLTTTYVICESYAPFEMIDFMQGTPDTIGVWYDSSINIVPGGIFDPASMDDALFTYVIDNLPGCQPVFRSMFVDEQTQRSAGTSANVMVCEGSSPFNMLNQLNDSPNDGGSWTGPDGPVTPGGTDTFNPATMQDGIYTYSISSAAPCSTQTSTLTILFTQDNPSGLSSEIELCSTSNNLNMLNALEGNPISGGNWTSPAGEVVDGVFDPDQEPAGNYEYYYPNVGCNPGTSILSISVEAPVNAGSNGNATICQTDASFSLNSMLSSNASSGGTWSTGGNNVGNFFSPTSSGSFNFTYAVNASVCADDQASFTIFVQPAVAAPISQTVYLCSLQGEVNLSDYFNNLSSVYFEDANGALQSNLFNPTLEESTVLNVINPSGNSCPDQEGQLNILVLNPVIEDAQMDYDVCRSSELFDLNDVLPAAAIGMGTWYNSNNQVVSNFTSIDFMGEQTFIYEVIQPITCGGEQLQIELISFSPNDAGEDVSEIFCYTDSPALLNNLLPEAEVGAGSWYYNNQPFNAAEFDPGEDASGTYIYRIPANGPCPADEALVELDVQYGIDYTAGTDIHVCAGSENQMLGGNPAADATYTWFPISALDNPQSPAPSVNIPPTVNQVTSTVYSVFADDGVCTFTDYVTVTIEPNPIINLNSSYDICFGETLSLENVVNTECVWAPANLFGDVASISPVIQPATSVYIGVEATSDFGCTTSAFSQVNVNPLPILVAQPAPIEGCKPVLLEIIPMMESQNIDQIIWNVAGLGTFTGDSLSISLMNAGIYDVEAIAVSEFNCVSNIFFEEVAEVYPSPLAHFTVSPSELTTLEPEAEFINHSTENTAYHWWFNGLSESAEMNPTFSFPNERSDNFYVCLDVTNQFGCKDTSCRYIYMDADYVVFAPNAFTPDGDGDNDVWKPVIRGFDTQAYELSIFNRWGERVFHTENPDAPWTGDVFSGDFFGQNEAYNWRLTLRVSNSAEEINFTGSIVLVR